MTHTNRFIVIFIVLVIIPKVRSIPSIERCNRILNKCPRRFHLGPVCGSDGRTYSSECRLIRKVCKKGRNLEKQYDGPCVNRDVMHYTYNVYNPHNNKVESDSEEGALPKINYNVVPGGIVTHVDNDNWSPKIEENKRPKNRNQRKRRKHKLNRRIYVDSSSDEQERSQRYDIGSREKRRRRPNQSRRRHHKKLPTMEPIIPTEKFQLKTTVKCQLKTTVPKKVEKTTTIKPTQPKATPTADCSSHYCSPLLPKVPFCASNGKTYNTLCEMELDVCILRDSSITVKYDGPCIQAEGRVECPQYCPLLFEPVCGTDRKTYPSACWLKAVSCQKEDYKLSVLYPGRCKVKVEEKDSERPMCKRTCPTEFKRVCGSDGVTYANKCLLELDSCKDPGLTVVMQGPCPPTTT